MYFFSFSSGISKREEHDGENCYVIANKNSCIEKVLKNIQLRYLSCSRLHCYVTVKIVM